MTNTTASYQLRLEDLVCDMQGCEGAPVVVNVYRCDDGNWFHSFGCIKHQKPLSLGSTVSDEEYDAE
jgi:hypothetical protein